MGVLIQAKNGDNHFLKQKFHEANGKAQHALKVPWLFFLKFWVGGQGEELKKIPLFPTCSHQVPNGFPSGSQDVP
jgi:hypothetical protein